MIVKNKKKWRNYDKEDYRIEPYCKGECPRCVIDGKGQAFCFGKFIKDGRRYNGNGHECTKTIDFCFADDVRTIH